MIKPSTKIKIDKFVNELRKPENSRKLKKVFVVFWFAFFGLCFSTHIMGSGLNLVVESGVPEGTIKAIVGVVSSIFGFTLFLWSLVRPVGSLYKIMLE